MSEVRAGVADQSQTAAGTPPIVLASASPRRAALLRMLGLEFDIVPAEIDETARPGETHTAMAERLAVEKVDAVAAGRSDAIVIGSDTVVLLDDDVLTKPTDGDDAVRMLLRLQGREHRVATGIAVTAPGRRTEHSIEVVRVRFRPFDADTAEAYVATGEPLDKAGAYGIQGYGATLVDLIEGDFFAVMGLPLARMVSLLNALGFRYEFPGLRRLEA